MNYTAKGYALLMTPLDHRLSLHRNHSHQMIECTGFSQMDLPPLLSRCLTTRCMHNMNYTAKGYAILMTPLDHRLSLHRRPLITQAIGVFVLLSILSMILTPATQFSPGKPLMIMTPATHVSSAMPLLSTLMTTPTTHIMTSTLYLLHMVFDLLSFFLSDCF